MSSGLVFKTHLHPKSMGQRGHAPPAVSVANTPKSHALAKQPIMVISAAAVKNGDRDVVEFEATAVGVSGGCGGGDATLVMQRRSTTGAVVTTHRVPTVPIVGGQATFRHQKVRLGTLALGDKEMRITASVQVNGCGGLSEAGRVDFTAASWAELGASISPDAPQKVKLVQGAAGSSTPASCTLMLKKWRLTEYPPLVDYLGGGLDINLVVAIDFTASNGPPQGPGSLHYIGGGASSLQRNQYLEAMSTIGTIIGEYGITEIPAFGFGAQLPAEQGANHCFPLTLDPSRPAVVGLEGVKQAYMHAVRSVTLWGPTNFAPIINKIAEIASHREAAMLSGGPLAFEVLLIITDGVITDLPDTISAIVKASKLPMAIIIVGVGGADFDAMDYLDADEGMLKDMYGNEAVRDIVQFVPMRNYLGRDRWALAADTLKELPDQIVDYFVMRGIRPRPRQVALPTPAPMPGAGGGAAAAAAGGGGAGMGGMYPPGAGSGIAASGGGGYAAGGIPTTAQDIVLAVGSSGAAPPGSAYPPGPSGPLGAAPGYPGTQGPGGPGYPAASGAFAAKAALPGGGNGVRIEMGPSYGAAGTTSPPQAGADSASGAAGSLPYPTAGVSGEASAPRSPAPSPSGQGTGGGIML